MQVPATLTPQLLIPPSVRRTALIAKLTLCFLLFSLLQVNARGFTQKKVTIKVHNASIESVFSKIKEQTGFGFVFFQNQIAKTHPVTITVYDEFLNVVLDSVFKSQPLTYLINETQKIVIIKDKAIQTEHSDIPGISALSLMDVHGRVVNELDQPLSGITITIRGTSKMTQTDANGEFYISHAAADAVLVFSGINVDAFEYNIAGQNNIVIHLKARVNRLDEVQVIAYGSTTQRFNTASVVSIKAAEIADQPINNALLALEGRVPGAFITQSTGFSGSGVTVRIRGQNSISNGNDPFYVVDGVPYISQLLPNQASILGGSGGSSNGVTGSGNPLSFINPSDIESIEVLKDADATAIYGSRAANGAILITTKKGKAGQTRLDVNVENGWGKVGRKLDLLDRNQYLQMRHEAIKNDGLTVGPNDFDINGTWDTTRNVNWQKELLGGAARYSDLQASVSGGGNNTRYIIGGGFHRETTVFPGDFSDKKGSLHFSISSSSNDQRFKVLLTGSYLYDDNSLPGVDLTGRAVVLAPIAPSPYLADGTLNWAPATVGGAGTFANPIAALYRKYKGTTGNLIANSVLSYRLFKQLELKTNLGYSNMQVNETNTTPLPTFDPALWSQGNSLRSAAYSLNSTNSYIIEPQVAYNNSFGKNRVDVLIGTTFQSQKNNGATFNGSNYTSDLLLEDLHSAGTLTNSTVISEYKYNALFGRISYARNNKYLLNLTGRRDGSSRFGPENQFHNFGAIGAAWVFSNERFMGGLANVLSFGKLRGSYGTTGNDQIGDYRYLDLYTSVTFGNPYQNTNGLRANNLFNPYLQWEETRKIEGALEIGFIKDRIILTLEYYRNRTSNQLIAYSLPSISGFTSISANLPATVQNSGLEISVNSVNIKNRNFTWSTSFNITIPKNELIAFDNLAQSSYANYFAIGKPVNSALVYHVVRVNDTTGLYQFGDSKGNPTYTPNAQNTLVNISPDYYGALSNTISYHGIELGFMFQFVKQLGRNYIFGALPGRFGQNQPTSVLGRWEKVGDLANVQRYASSTATLVNGNSVNVSYTNATTSDLFYSDASYVRLKNLALSWQIPELWLKRIHVQQMKVFTHAQNLLTFTHYQGLDPESRSSLTLPPLRVITVGLHLIL